MADADWHTYILLTQQPGRIGPGWYIPQGNEYLGLTIRNQQDADERLPDFLSIPGKKWISYEPAVGGFDLLAHDPKGLCGEAQQYAWENLQGIIIGHDRRKGAPGTETLSHIRSCVEQCKAAGVNWWVKQVWVELCALCGCLRGYPAASNPCPHTFLETTKPAWRWMLLRASKRFEYALFPEDLRDGARLPWSAPKEQSDENP